MKNKILKAIIFSVVFISCDTKVVKYKKVVLITATTQTMMVTHTNVNDNRLSHAARGAAIGYILGGKMKHGLIGGAIGLATSDAPTSNT